MTRHRIWMRLSVPLAAVALLINLLPTSALAAGGPAKPAPTGVQPAHVATTTTPAAPKPPQSTVSQSLPPAKNLSQLGANSTASRVGQNIVNVGGQLNVRTNNIQTCQQSSTSCTTTGSGGSHSTSANPVSIIQNILNVGGQRTINSRNTQVCQQSSSSCTATGANTSSSAGPVAGLKSSLSSAIVNVSKTGQNIVNIGGQLNIGSNNLQSCQQASSSCTSTVTAPTSAPSTSQNPPIINISNVVQNVVNVGGRLNIGSNNIQTCQQASTSCTSSVTPPAAPTAAAPTSTTQSSPIINVSRVVENVVNVGGILNIGSNNIQSCQQASSSCTSTASPSAPTGTNNVQVCSQMDNSCTSTSTSTNFKGNGQIVVTSVTKTINSGSPPIINVSQVVENVHNVDGRLHVGGNNVQVCQQASGSCTSTTPTTSPTSPTPSTSSTSSTPSTSSTSSTP